MSDTAFDLYPTTTEQKNAKAFPKGRYHYDGHGINRDGDRILTCSEAPYFNGNERNENRDKMAEEVAKFCAEAHRLQIDTQRTVKPDTTWHPRIFLTLDTHELNTHFQQVVCVEVRRPDGKIARFNLSLSASDDGQKCKGKLYVQGKTEASDSHVERTGKFVDYSS